MDEKEITAFTSMDHYEEKYRKLILALKDCLHDDEITTILRTADQKSLVADDLFDTSKDVLKMPLVGVRKCPCKELECDRFWLTGIGVFKDGTGFTQQEATMLYNYLKMKPKYHVVHAIMQPGDPRGTVPAR